MAELPRYRPLGVAIPTVPNVDFVSAGRAQGDVYRSIGKSVDVMVDYVYKRQVAQTKREAAKYAFENPVTAQQIQDAISQGRDIEEIVGDPDTIFGAVTTATAAQQLTTELEIRANKKIAEYNAAIKSGGLYSNEQITEMRRDLTSMIDAHSELIAGVDPAQALKYNAAANTSASTVYKSALEAQMSINKAVKIAAADEFMETLPERAKDILTKKDADLESRLGELTVLARSANDVVISTGDLVYAKAQSSAIQKVITDVQVGVLTDHVINLPQDKRLRALRSGDMGDLTPLYNMLDSKQQAEFRSGVRAELAARQTTDDQIEKDGLKINKKSATVQALAFAEAPEGSQEERFALDGLEQIAIDSNGDAISAQGILALKKAKTAAAAEETPNYVAEFRIKQMINAEQITTFDELQTEAAALGVGPKATLGLVPYLDSTTKETRREVDREAKAHAAIVPGMLNVSKKKAERHNRFVNAVENRFADAMDAWEENPDRRLQDKPVIAKIAKEYRKELLQSEHQKKIDTTVAGLASKYPNLDITENSEYDYFATNRVALGLSTDDLKNIKRKLGFIEQQALLRDEIR